MTRSWRALERHSLIARLPRSTAGNLPTISSRFLIPPCSGSGSILYPARLSRMELNEDNVRYYTTDETGKINRRILDDATGDMDTYGILTPGQ